MSNLEHYFENLLLLGEDCGGDVNKKALTKEQREAVETCVDYIIYTLFGNRDLFNEWLRRDGFCCYAGPKSD